jgi:hypothetical protein
MYMVREVIQAQRGKAPEIVAGFNILDQMFEQAGYTNRRIYVDYDGPMDTSSTRLSSRASTSTSATNAHISPIRTRTRRRSSIS